MSSHKGVETKMSSEITSVEQLRMIAKVAQMYHSQSMRQTDIAKLLGVSQARVSRILSSAEQLGIVRTKVVSPDGLFPEQEQMLEKLYGLSQVHVVAVDQFSKSEASDELGKALASVLEVMPLEGLSIGFTPWSRSLRHLAREFSPSQKISAKAVVELMGGVGPPAVQHEATVATDLFAKATGAEVMFLRAPSVVKSKELASSIIDNDPHAKIALQLMNNLDIALLGLGSCEIVPPMEAGNNFPSEAQLQAAMNSGAVGQINLRFFDSNGKPVRTELDELVLGITHEQMMSTPIRIGVAGGEAKRDALRAALKGKLINVLVTDYSDAEYLIEQALMEQKATGASA